LGRLGASLVFQYVVCVCTACDLSFIFSFVCSRFLKKRHGRERMRDEGEEVMDAGEGMRHAGEGMRDGREGMRHEGEGMRDAREE
jgi:hypothetical protein